MDFDEEAEVEEWDEWEEDEVEGVDAFAICNLVRKTSCG